MDPTGVLDGMKSIFSIEPEDAAARGLPPLRLSADTTGLPLIPRKFPDVDTYVAWYDPLSPGIGLSIHPLAGTAPDAGGLAKWAAWKMRGDPTFRVGPKGELGLRGIVRPCRVYFDGPRHDIAAHIAIALAGPRIIVVLSLGRSLLHIGCRLEIPDRIGTEELVRCIVAQRALSGILLRLNWEDIGDPAGTGGGRGPLPDPITPGSMEATARP